jgi:apolipoprotein N-acyltransferase
MRLIHSNIIIRFTTCLISGAVLALAFPSADISVLAWVAPAPFLMALMSAGTFGALICGFLFGIGFFGVLLYWIGTFGLPALIALVIFQSLFMALFGVLANYIIRRRRPLQTLIAIPALWVSIEWLRSLGMFGFTWGQLGYSQYKALPVIQIASITGVWGVSYLIVLFNMALADLLTNSRRPSKASAVRFASVVLIAVLVLAFGYWQLSSPLGKREKALNISVIQGNIDQGVNEDDLYTMLAWNTYARLTRQVSAHSDLVVWPETVVPGSVADGFTRDRLTALSSAVGTCILAGGWDRDRSGYVYNSAFMTVPQRGITSRYSKMHLVPFGEYVPARKHADFLKRFNVTPYDTSPGRNCTPLECRDAKIGVRICFESIFPHLVRQSVLKGAEILCILTNDCWYDDSSGAEQHLAFSVFRAVENNRYLIHAATTGISCFIDQRGRITHRTHVMQEAAITERIPAINVRTFYSRYGDWLVILCIIITLLALIHPRLWIDNRITNWRSGDDNDS